MYTARQNLCMTSPAFQGLVLTKTRHYTSVTYISALLYGYVLFFLIILNTVQQSAASFHTEAPRGWFGNHGTFGTFWKSAGDFSSNTHGRRKSIMSEPKDVSRGSAAAAPQVDEAQDVDASSNSMCRTHPCTCCHHVYIFQSTCLPLLKAYLHRVTPQDLPLATSRTAVPISTA